MIMINGAFIDPKEAQKKLIAKAVTFDDSIGNQLRLFHGDGVIHLFPRQSSMKDTFKRAGLWAGCCYMMGSL